MLKSLIVRAKGIPLYTIYIKGVLFADTRCQNIITEVKDIADI